MQITICDIAYNDKSDFLNRAHSHVKNESTNESTVEIASTEAAYELGYKRNLAFPR